MCKTMTNQNQQPIANTKNSDYAQRLVKLQTAKWKKWLNVQAPYRWNLQQIKMGFTFDIGCGIGRNLINLDGYGVGIDHNLDSVKICQSRGLHSFTTENFNNSSWNVPESFDSILLSHVAEHMTYAENIDLISQYIYLLKPEGKLVIITPQEVGYRSDSSHVEFINFTKVARIYKTINFQIIKQYSFPFPRILGHLFIYNEFISVGQKPINYDPRKIV